MTLLSSADYLDAVLVLHQSLCDVRSKYPLLVVVTNTVFTPKIEEIFISKNILYEVVDPMFYSKTTIQRDKGKTVLNTASKIQIFFLYQWDKLVYIDADTLVIDNIDNLFQYPDGSMIYYDKADWGFSGLFVFSPRNHKESDYFETIMQYCDCYDGDLLGKIWFYVKQNPNYQIPGCYLQPYFANRTLPIDTRVIHYANEKKPWLLPNDDFFSVKYEGARLYKETLAKIKHN